MVPVAAALATVMTVAVALAAVMTGGIAGDDDRGGMVVAERWRVKTVGALLMAVATVAGTSATVMAVRWWREGDVVAVTSPCVVTVQFMEDSAVPASGTSGTREEERPRKRPAPALEAGDIRRDIGGQGKHAFFMLSNRHVLMRSCPLVSGVTWDP